MSTCPQEGGLAALEVAIAEVEAAEQRLAAVTEHARARLHESVTSLTRVANAMWTELDSSVDLRAIAARRLYWGVPSLPLDNIAVALGYRSKAEMTAAAGEVETGVACTDCGAELKASSRTQLKEITAAGSRPPQRHAWRDPLRCPPCKQAHRQRQEEEERQRWMATLDEDDTIVAGPWDL
jgi:hypothetical protein